MDESEETEALAKYRAYQAEHPLTQFSIYTHVQTETLKRAGKEILSLTKGWGLGAIDNYEEVYGRFWLWVLGAYEVVRTMSQHRRCFSVEAEARIEAMKTDLEEVRMPFAKQEPKGKRGCPIYPELSGAGFQDGVLFTVGSRTYNSNELIRTFLAFVDAFKLGDVLREITTGDRLGPR